MKSVLTTLLSGLLASIAVAGPFAAPSEGVPPFRRASLPIDTDSISGLSANLTILAQGAALETPPQRRATAQGLALALALDPENQTARSILKEIAGGKSPGAPDAQKTARAKAHIWKVLGWLASPEAGNDGNLLADLLGDAASVLDPGHPEAVALRESKERGMWDGWVAPVSAFTERKPETARPLAETDPVAPEKGKAEPLPSPRIKAAAASIGAVLSVYDDATEKYVSRHTTVSMEAGPHAKSHKETPGFRIDIPCPERWGDRVRENVSSPILDALGKLHGSRLPEGKVSILTASARGYSYSRNGHDLTAPGLVLANAAVTGIAPDATIIARLDGKGGIALPDYFWRKLGTLADGPGGRLIVPAAAADYFTAMLALEKPEFFLKYEVLTASSPAEAIALCAKEPNEAHAEAFAKFRKIKDKAGTDPLGTYLANRFVRQRLEKITAAAPYHLSAKLLAIQGVGERPRMLARNILAAEVFEAIDPIHDFADLDIYEFSERTAGSMEETHDAARARLDGLERYAEIQDRDLVSHGIAVTSALRSLHRVINGRGGMWEKYEQVASAHKALKSANQDLRAELSMVTGDPLPEDAAAR